MVFVDQNGQNVARNYNPNPKQPDNAAQKAVRGRFTQVAAFWDALSTSQKLAWATAAQGRKGSGWNLYQSLANVWLNAHNNVGTPPSSPPSGEYAGSSITITAVAASGHVTFTGSAATPAGTQVQFELQPLRNAARKPSKGGYRVAGFGIIEAENEYEFPVAVNPGAYAARYAFVEISSGRRTPFVEIPVSGVALAIEQGGAAEKPLAAPKKKVA